MTIERNTINKFIYYFFFFIYFSLHFTLSTSRKKNINHKNNNSYYDDLMKKKTIFRVRDTKHIEQKRQENLMKTWFDIVRNDTLCAIVQIELPL